MSRWKVRVRVRGQGQDQKCGLKIRAVSDVKFGVRGWGQGVKVRVEVKGERSKRGQE